MRLTRVRNMFDAIRYYIALLLIVWAPGALLYWFVIHPFAGFWRRVGYRWGLAAAFGTMAASAVLLAMQRSWLLAVDWSTNIGTIVAGCIFLAAAIVMRRKRGKMLSFRTLLGLPELAPERFPPKLLTGGIYSSVRHPRYAEVLFAVIGYALLSNYPAAYGVVIYFLAMFGVLIPMEERELAARFGEEYEEYRRRVPALIPRVR